jgi:hypothetical protein
LYLQSVLHFRQIFVVFQPTKEKWKLLFFFLCKFDFFWGIICQISGVTKLKNKNKNPCLQSHCKLRFPCLVPKFSSQWLFCFTTHCSTH